MPAGEKTKMLSGQLYHAGDPGLVEERTRARQLCRAYNATAEDDEPNRKQILSALLGSVPEDILIEPSFRCDYGYNIHLGEHFYANFDLIILDVCAVRIGCNCLCGPRVSILTATHPMDSGKRSSGLEYGRPVTIGDNVWLGAGVIVNPGVRIGNNVVLASGAVVTKDLEDNVLAGGVPARIIRPLD